MNFIRSQLNATQAHLLNILIDGSLRLKFCFGVVKFYENNILYYKSEISICVLIISKQVNWNSKFTKSIASILRNFICYDRSIGFHSYCIDTDLNYNLQTKSIKKLFKLAAFLVWICRKITLQNRNIFWAFSTNIASLTLEYNKELINIFSSFINSKCSRFIFLV